MSRDDMQQSIEETMNALYRDQVEDEAEDKVWVDLLRWIVELAAEIWDDGPGLQEDFCLQHASFPTIVFGGVNRVVWSPRHGFQISESHCTERFKKRFAEWI